MATRDCRECQEWIFDEQTGERTKHKRPNPNLTPCRVSKCAKGTPENQLSLTPQNMAAYLHYCECRAVRSFPDDPLVRLHAATIRAVEDSIERLRSEQSVMGNLLALSRGRR